MKKSGSKTKRIEEITGADGVERVKVGHHVKPSRPVSIELLMKKSASKSEDSLDSGIYSRQKSCDSMDSLDSTDGLCSSVASSNHLLKIHSSNKILPSSGGGNADIVPTPTDELLPEQQFDDYWRELEDVEISRDHATDDDVATTPTDVSAEDEPDGDADGDWLKKAGLLPLLNAATRSPSSSTQPSKHEVDTTTIDDESMSYVLHTLTKTQRQAVLRRVTSFNRVQQQTHPLFERVSRAIDETLFNEEAENEELDSATGSRGGEKLTEAAHHRSEDSLVDVGSLDRLSVSSSSTTATTTTQIGQKSASLPRGSSQVLFDDDVGGIATSSSLRHSHDVTTTHRRYSEASSLKKSNKKKEVETSFSSSGKSPAIARRNTMASSSGAENSPKPYHKRSFKNKFKGKLKKSNRGQAMVEAFDGSSKGIETLRLTTHTNDLSTTASTQMRGEPPTDEMLSYSELASDELPQNFQMHSEDLLGTTRISDLHIDDLQSIQHLAHIELSSLLDQFGLELKRRKSVVKQKLKAGDTSCVFGVPLSTLVKRDQLIDPDTRVPLVLKTIIEYLKSEALSTEGILRKSGSTARVKSLKEDLDKRFSSGSPAPSTETWEQNVHPHDVASLLKQFLRELPEPLLSNEYVDSFQSCEGMSDKKSQLKTLNMLIILLKPQHRDSLKYLLEFLKLVVESEDTNKMSLNNVAMITAPNLFLPSKHKQQKGVERNIKKAAGISNIVRMLIKYQQHLWTIPSFMLTQVRYMRLDKPDLHVHKKNSSKDSKHKMKLFKVPKDTNKKPVISAVKDCVKLSVQIKVVKIHDDTEASSSNFTTVKLSHDLSVEDVLAGYIKKINKTHQNTGRESVSEENFDLYEVGGNLKERRLDPRANMYALVFTNQNAVFKIRKRLPDRF